MEQGLRPQGEIKHCLDLAIGRVWLALGGLFLSSFVQMEVFTM